MAHPHRRPPQLANETVVEVLYSNAGRARAIIGLGSDGIYRVRTERWTDPDPENQFEKEGYWSPQHVGTLTDNVQNARKLANEQLESEGM